MFTTVEPEAYRPRNFPQDFGVPVQGAAHTFRTRRETDMRVLTLAALLIAAFILPADARVQPVRGAVHGTATAARGVGHGAVQAGRGIGRGAVCVFTLGTRCR
jgi:hypothetical protein